MAEISIIVYFVSIICLTGTIDVYREWSADNFPNPVKDIHSCGHRGVQSWICDPDGIISYEKVNQFEEIIFAISKETNSGCSMDTEKPGFQLGLALMRKMNVDQFESADKAAQSISKRLHNKWGVGHKDCDDGALFVIATEDRKMYISTGKTAKKVLTDEQIELIMDEIKSPLRRKNFEKGLEIAVVRIREVFNGHVIKKKSSSFVRVVVILLFLGLFFFMYITFKQANKFKECKQKLERIEEERNKARNSKNYESQSCPICLENFTNTDPPTDPPMIIRTLLCGHKYCEQCLLKWLESNATCPICRQAAKTTDEERGSEFRSGDYDFQADLQFRLLNLSRMYPDFVTLDMINRWSSCQYQESFVSDAMFARAGPTLQLGSSGSGGGFGDGGCFDGGGRGSSW